MKARMQAASGLEVAWVKLDIDRRVATVALLDGDEVRPIQVSQETTDDYGDDDLAHYVKQALTCARASAAGT